MPRKHTDHAAEMKAAGERAARPRETADERNARRLATANALRMRAEFDILAARAAAAKMPAKTIAAIRCVPEVHALLLSREMVTPHLDAWLDALDIAVQSVEMRAIDEAAQ